MKPLIAAEDVLRHLKAWSADPITHPGCDMDHTDDLANHLAGNLAMVAQARADKLLEAAEKVIEAGNEAYRVMGGRFIISFSPKNRDYHKAWEAWRAALDAYEESAP